MKPSHFLCVVSDVESTDQATGETTTKARFTEICAVWPSRSGKGYNCTIPAGVTITGRIFISEASAGQQ